MSLQSITGTSPNDSHGLAQHSVPAVGSAAHHPKYSFGNTASNPQFSQVQVLLTPSTHVGVQTRIGFAHTVPTVSLTKHADDEPLYLRLSFVQ